MANRADQLNGAHHQQETGEDRGHEARGLIKRGDDPALQLLLIVALAGDDDGDTHDDEYQGREEIQMTLFVVRLCLTERVAFFLGSGGFLLFLL